MKRFVWRDDRIEARLDELDHAVLGLVPSLLTGVGELGVDPAAARLQPAVYRDDPEKSAEFLRLSSGIVEEGRQADLELFKAGYEDIADGAGLTPAEAEAWSRTITHARLVVGARLGIEDDGWEESAAVDQDDPHVAVLLVLGRLQESLMAALSSGL
jgi:hypothetical protein